ncbi:MAG: amino acid ABC transporter substrate-binding protein [Desulfobacterales bacterium]|nr:amino acid ABC transporter substrate-binding protein [Desulfobacterales bacterium]MCP4159330.1 amino acid ABC transporter substrate-binding protein [Deltaproteobacteria bacterium]
MLQKITKFTIILIFLNMVVNAQECKVLRVAGANGWLPMSFTDPSTGKPVGVAYDFARLVGKKLKRAVVIRNELPFRRILKYLEDGELDICVSLYWNEERAAKYLFTEPYFVNQTRVWVVKGKEFPFKTFDDLIGRVGGIPAGGSLGAKFDAFAKAHNLKLEEVKTKKQRFFKMLRGRTDYLLQDYYDGLTFLKHHGLQDQFVALDRPLSENKVYFAVSRKSPCADLLPQINYIIKKAKQDGIIQALIKKYTR